MRYAHTVRQVRSAEAALAATLPDGELMRRAAYGIATVCARLLGRVYGVRVALLVGGGDNGADALWVGAALAGRGARVDAVLLREPAPAALAALRAMGGRVVPAVPADSELVIDGLVGIGGSGPLRDEAAALVRSLPSAALVVAVDVPSGVDADTGAVRGVAVHADVTASPGTRKPGLLVSPGAAYAGIVELIDIGLAPYLEAASVRQLDADDVAGLLPRAAAESSKYTRGVVGVVAGSEAYTGAAVLATGGALRAGAGMVRFVGPPHPAEQVRGRWPEAVVRVVPPGDGEAVLDAGQVQAWVIGPGVGTAEAAETVLAAVLGTELPVLVDADSLTVLARAPELVAGRAAPTLLTPHVGEFARLAGGGDRADVEADRLTAARALAADLGVTVLLKGSTTVVAAPGGNVLVNPTGTSALASAGSGDVLSGAAGALLAGGLGAADAGAVAAFLHGLAGRLAAAGGASLVAEDLITHWPAAVRLCQRRPD